MTWNSPTTFPPTLTEVLGVTLTLGLRKEEIDANFDQILQFAEIGEFISSSNSQ